MKPALRLLFFGLALLAAGSLAWGDEAAFRVGGDVAKPGEWTAARLARDFAGKVETVRYTMAGKEHTARCVPLLAVVQAAEPRIDPNRKNHRVGFVVVLRARDGYTVAFSLAELSQDLGNRPVWIALDTDGKPLPANEGPVRLLVPGEGTAHRPRWTFGITTIAVLDGAKLAKER
jgi:DMSO/TMAO reductase YedYZ molybdopterin-dependent catalytic subunit